MSLEMQVPLFDFMKKVGHEVIIVPSMNGGDFTLQNVLDEADVEMGDLGYVEWMLRCEPWMHFSSYRDGTLGRTYYTFIQEETNTLMLGFNVGSGSDFRHWLEELCDQRDIVLDII